MIYNLINSKNNFMRAFMNSAKGYICSCRFFFRTKRKFEAGEIMTCPNCKNSYKLKARLLPYAN